MIEYQGACHCRAVTFSFICKEKMVRGTRCNCSFCSKLGITHSEKIDPNNFKLVSGIDFLQSYFFGDQVVDHKFCMHCGIYVFYTGSQCKVNPACVDGLDITCLSIESYDGANLL